MSPEKILSKSEQGTITDIVKRYGRPIQGDAYEIPLKNGLTHVAVLTDSSITTNETLISIFDNILKGTDYFEMPSSQKKAFEVIPPYTGEITEELTIADLFNDIDTRLASRIENSLSQAGKVNVSKIITLLNKEGDEGFSMGVRNFGPKSCEGLKQRLGMI